MHTEFNNETLRVSGDITVKTLTGEAFERFQQQCRLNGIIAVDFSGACVSLLLEILRRRKDSIRLTGIPESVRALSELYEIKDWLKS